MAHLLVPRIFLRILGISRHTVWPPGWPWAPGSPMQTISSQREATLNPRFAHFASFPQALRFSSLRPLFPALHHPPIPPLVHRRASIYSRLRALPRRTPSARSPRDPSSRALRSSGASPSGEGSGAESPTYSVSPNSKVSPVRSLTSSLTLFHPLPPRPRNTLIHPAPNRRCELRSLPFRPSPLLHPNFEPIPLRRWVRPTGA